MISIGVLLLTSSILAQTSQFEVHGIKDKRILINAKSRVSIKLKDLLKSNSTQVSSLGIAEIKKAVQPFGYFNSQVTAKINSNLNSIIFTVQLNKPSNISSIHIGIIKPKNTPFDQRVFKHTVRQYKHKIFTQENYQDLKHDIQSKLTQQGYLFSTLTKTDAIVNPKNHTVEIHIKCNLNKRALFGDIEYFGKGLSKVFLDRFSTINKGDLYQTNAINAFRNKLLKSGLFKSIRVTPNLDNNNNNNNNNIPVQVSYQPTDYYNYTIGLGIDSKQSLQLKSEIHLPRFNSIGHALNLLIEGSWTDINNKGYEINAKNQYIIPGLNPLTDQFIFEFNQHSKFNQRLDDSRESEISLEFKDKIMDINRSFSINYLYGVTLPKNRFKSVESYLLYPKIGVDTLIQYPSINTKAKIFMQLIAASQNIASDENLIRFLIKSTIKRQFYKGQRMYIKMEQGFLQTSNINQIPTSMKFSTGGANSLRGFAYNSLGYGKYYRLLSLELQTPITSSWYLTGFYDTGFASMQRNPKSNQSSGFGLTWDSTIGNIGVTVATPLNQTKRKWLVQLSIQSSI